MKTALFLPKEIFENSKLVVECMAKEYDIHIEDNVEKCLCQIDDIEELDQYSMIIAHPHRSEKCLKKVRRIIESKPKIEFYLIALMDHNRIEKIGEHPNLRYITEEPDKKGLLN